MRPRTESTSHYLVSVIVPTYRRPGLLRQCLTALCRQTLPHDCYEIVIVDDGIDTDTQREVESWMLGDTLPAIRYLTTPAVQSGPAVARNIGWRAARAEIIAFTDDDCQPDPEWLAAGTAAFKDAEVSGAWGRILVPLPEDPTDYECNTAGLEEAPCATANCFYRTTALRTVGGFDERFTAAWREDSDLQFALIETNHQIVAVREAVVVHPIRPATWGISLRQQRNNLFNALLFKKHPALYRRVIQDPPPWHYYVNAGALLSAAIGWSLGSAWLVVPGVALWTITVGQFCAYRLQNTSRRAAHIIEMLVTSALIPPVAIYWRLRGAIKYRVAFL
jgi:glycosyltransferase involved in cell wall biosynthesis